MPRRLHERTDEAVARFERAAAPITERLRVLGERADKCKAFIEHGGLARIQPQDARRFIVWAQQGAAEMRRLLEVLDRIIVNAEALAGPLFPGNPTTVFSTDRKDGRELAKMFRPDRIYLDVTDSTREQVLEVWTLVEWGQRELQAVGGSRKRGQGTPKGPRTEEGRRWVARALEVGEPSAITEYKADGGGGGGDWNLRYGWWCRNVRRHLPKTR